ncbi:hypothetical protein GCM10009613_34920 [Pseudonocardia kongjuensis]|uniref:DUF5134 domain-containing protein n=1 Tax=Pseudonocardia kongjuensis TaxID=102227 RepID=A0ABN1XW83_9PSEU
MIASLPVALTLTALFVLTGGYALLRWSGAVAEAAPPGRRTSELAHLLMSAAMVVMTWTWYGTTGLWFQILLFGGFAVFFAADAVRRRRHRLHGCTGGSAHALMAAAMVWMLAAMPLIMPAPVTAPAGGGGHTGHVGHDAGADHAAHAAGQAGWAVGVTVALCAALLAVAGFWAVRALAADGHGHAADEDFPGVPLDPAGVGSDSTAATATGTGTGTGTGTATSTRTATPTRTATAGTSAGPGDIRTNNPAGPPTAVPAGTATGVPAGTATGSPAATGPGTTSTAVAEHPDEAGAPDAPCTPDTPRRPLFGPRTDAGCHALMSIGMVLMLAAMVAGW